MHPLPLTDVATGRLEQLGGHGQRRTGLDAAQAGVDSHSAATIPQVREDAAIGRLIERGRAGGRHRQVVVPHFGIKRVRDQDGDRSRLAGPGGENAWKSARESRPGGGLRSDA